MHERIADVPLDLGFLICLVLIEMQARDDLGRIPSSLSHYFPSLNYDIMRPFSSLCFGQTPIGHGYCALLAEHFSNPVHGGKYVLDGPRYALVARSFLDFFFSQKRL